jgi:fused signal recognition particle receptor
VAAADQAVADLMAAQKAEAERKAGDKQLKDDQRQIEQDRQNVRQTIEGLQERNLLLKEGEGALQAYKLAQIGATDEDIAFAESLRLSNEAIEKQQDEAKKLAAKTAKEAAKAPEAFDSRLAAAEQGSAAAFSSINRARNGGSKLETLIKAEGDLIKISNKLLTDIAAKEAVTLEVLDSL